MPSKKSKQSKNNFRKPENIDKTHYKLWMGLKNQYQGKITPVLYGYMTKKDFGLSSLQKQAQVNKQFYNKAILYYRAQPGPGVPFDKVVETFEGL